jgi:hypothetical protein
MLSRRLIHTVPYIRSNSTVASFTQYFKDKGMAIPFASKILNSDEYARYQLFRQIKLGEHEWFDNHTSLYPLKKEEKQTLVKYIDGLKDQPFNVPNVLIGYYGIWLGYEILLRSASLGRSVMSEYMADHIGFLMFSGSSLGYVCGCCGGCYSALYGIRLIFSEFKSPYLNYDEMLRICNKNEIKDIEYIGDATSSKIYDKY